MWLNCSVLTIKKIKNQKGKCWCYLIEGKKSNWHRHLSDVLESPYAREIHLFDSVAFVFCSIMLQRNSLVLKLDCYCFYGWNPSMYNVYLTESIWLILILSLLCTQILNCRNSQGIVCNAYFLPFPLFFREILN